VITTLKGKFQDFVYDSDVPGKLLKIVSPTVLAQDNLIEDTLPYPVVLERSEDVKKDMVIVFGNAHLRQSYSEYLPSDKVFVEKLAAFFGAFKDKYSDCKLYYKPHPADQDGIMSGINMEKYNLIDNTVNAQTLFDMYQKRIKAVYTFSSASIVLGSFLGIPSYTFYRHICNPAGIEMFDNMYDQGNIKSEFLFHIADLNEIGKVDDLEVHNYIDFTKLEESYRKALNV